MVIIPIEVKARDLHSRLSVADSLVQLGLDVIIGSERAILYQIEHIDGPYIYFDKSISINKQELYINFKRKGILICSIDEEGLSVVNNREGYITKRFSVEMLELVDKVFFWGQIDYKPIAQKFSKFSNKLVITGNPRMKVRPKTGVERYFCSFVSNFTVNHASGDKNFWAKLESMGRLKSESDKMRYFSLLDAQQKAFESFIEMIEVVLKSFPEKPFVVRPHPSESLVFWIELARKHKNLYVDEGGDKAINTIVSSEVMVHMGCTTGMESVMSGVKTITFQPKNTYIKSLSNIVSHKVTALPELLALLRNPSEIDSSVEKLSDEIVFEANTDLRIAMEINKLAKTIGSSPPIKFKQSIKSRIIKYRRFSPTSKGKLELYEYRKFPGLSEKEILHIIGSDSVKVSRLSTDIFLLQPK